MTDNELQQWRTGTANLITDVPGLKVGNSGDHTVKTGVTVLTADAPFVAAVDVMGGAPGTRETDCLAPDKLVQKVDALVLSGGSAFGLDAASGVVDALRHEGKGFIVGPASVPIVPAAIIFDLINGGACNWKKNPYQQLGKEAYLSAQSTFDLGSSGAGIGATTAALKGGLGSASLVLPGGVLVGALVVANPHGHVVIPGTRHFWAAPFELDKEYGGHGMPENFQPHKLPQNDKFKAYAALHGLDDSAESMPAGSNTTLAIVATNVAMDKAQLKRMAVAAQDGMARSIVPSHTSVDGDLVFAVSTSEQESEDAVADMTLVGHAAAVCLTRAIARGVYHAKSVEGDTLPAWHSLV